VANIYAAQRQLSEARQSNVDNIDGTTSVESVKIFSSPASALPTPAAIYTKSGLDSVKLRRSFVS